jgi:hypothetical protein
LADSLVFRDMTHFSPPDISAWKTISSRYFWFVIDLSHKEFLQTVSSELFFDRLIWSLDFSLCPAFNARNVFLPRALRFCDS